MNSVITQVYEDVWNILFDTVRDNISDSVRDKVEIYIVNKIEDYTWELTRHNYSHDSF